MTIVCLVCEVVEYPVAIFLDYNLRLQLTIPQIGTCVINSNTPGGVVNYAGGGLKASAGDLLDVISTPTGVPILLMYD